MAARFAPVTTDWYGNPICTTYQHDSSGLMLFGSDGKPLIQAVGLMHGAAKLIDLNHLICGPTTCQPIVGNVTVYRDTHHLTETYVETLRPYVEQQLLATRAFTDRHWA